MDKTIRMLLVDDHVLFRESLGRLLDAEKDFELLGSCSSVKDALPILETGAIDVILLDYDLGNERGIDLLRSLHGVQYNGKILMVTAGMRQTEIAKAIEAGVAGIFLKHSPPGELITAIHRVVNGEIWMDPRAIRSIASAALIQEGISSKAIMNEREREVLRGVFEGLSNKEIAMRMHISESYVKALLQQLFEKTGVRTRAQLVRVALEKRIE